MSESQITASEAVSATTQLVELDQVLRQRMDPEAYAIYEALAKERILSDDKFRVDLEKLRLALGWTQKSKAKRKLVQNFADEEDFVIRDVGQVGENPQAGRPAEQIMLTLEAAKHFAMMSGTSKARQVRNMFSQVVDIMQDFTHPREPTTSPALVVADPTTIALQLQLAQASLQLAQLQAMAPRQRQEHMTLKIAGDTASLLRSVQGGELNHTQERFIRDYTCNALAGGRDMDEHGRFIVPVSDLYKNITGKPGNSAIWKSIGRALAKEYRLRNDGEEPRTVERWVDGTMRNIKAYIMEDNTWITEEVEKWVRENGHITRAIAAPVSLPKEKSGIRRFFTSSK